jgi:plasmid stabilization system protein ParE
MPSGYRIDWSDEALNNLRNILNYLIENWTERELRNFTKKLESRLTLIQQNPFLFPASSKKRNVRRSVLTYQITIYYRIDKNVIMLLSLFDTRQNPRKLKL